MLFICVATLQCFIQSCGMLNQHETLPEEGMLCKYIKLCVFSLLLFIIQGKYFNLCIEAPQAAFGFAYGRYPANNSPHCFSTSWNLLACAEI